MKLSNINVMHLERLASKKNIILFGAGGKLNELIDTYCDFDFCRKIEFIVDNNEKRWGDTVDIKGRPVKIESPDKIREIDLSKYVIIVTPLVYEPMFCQLQNMLGNSVKYIYRLSGEIYRIERFYKWLMRKLPLKKNMILLRGQGDTCENAVQLVEYMKANKYPYKYVWLCDDVNSFKYSEEDKCIRWQCLKTDFTKKRRLEYIYYSYRAQYIIFENTHIDKERPDQISVYLKHGEFPIKYVVGLITMPKDLNYTFAATDYGKKIISEQYSVNPERVFENACPRTDVLFTSDDREQVKELLKLDQYDKNILWMPTFRNHSNGSRQDSNKKYYMDLPGINNEEELLALSKALQKNNIQLILKVHKYQCIEKTKSLKMKNITFLSQDILEVKGINNLQIMKYVDAMLTDYSSAAFDFMVLDRPLGYVIDDIDDYNLGFVIDNILDLMPGKKIRNIADFIEFIEEVKGSKDDFHEERQKVNALINGNIKGTASKNLCHILKLREK